MAYIENLLQLLNDMLSRYLTLKITILWIYIILLIAGGLMGYIKAKSKSSVYKFLNSLEIFGIGYSWGGYSSLAVYNDTVEMGTRRFFKLGKKNGI